MRVAVIGGVLALLGLLVWLARDQHEAGNAESRPAPVSATPEADPVAVPSAPSEPAIVPLAQEERADNAAGDDAFAGDLATEPELHVTVAHAGGSPASGAGVVSAVGEDVLDAQLTDAQGVARLLGSDGPLDLYVGGATLAPQRFPVEVGRGDHLLELPRGALLGGIVLVDGRTPESPVGLTLVSIDEDPVWEAPSAVRKRLRLVECSWGSDIGQDTTAGRFLFSGLPEDWSGYIEFPAALRLERGFASHEFFVKRPATDVVLRLIHAGAVIGRVLDPAVGAESPKPSPYAKLMTIATRSGNSFAVGITAGADGDFCLPLQGDEAFSVELQIQNVAEDGRLVVRQEGLDPLLEHDLGDLLLLPTRRAEFIARDEAGRPIEGAVAVALDTMGARSEPTAANGRGELSSIMADTGAMRVHALGYDPTDVALPAAPPGAPIEVRLRAAAQVELHLLTAEGRPSGKVLVEYRAQEPVFGAGGHGGVDAMQTTLGATMPHLNGVGEGGEVYGRAWSDERGHCLFTRLRPGVPFTIRVVDATGAELRAPEQLVLAPVERRVLEWALRGTPRVVKVAVRRAVDGTPIGAATVSIRASDAPLSGTDWSHQGNGRIANEAGEAEFTGVFSYRVSLQAARPGFGTAWLLDQFVPPEGASFEMLMAEGRTVDIEVLDADGLPCEVSDVSMIDGPLRVQAEPVEVGLHRLLDAPAGTVTLTALLGQRRYSTTHDTSQPRARIVIPRLGKLSVRWTVPLQPDLTYSVLARCVDPDTWSRYFVVHDKARAANGPIGFGDLLPGEYEVALRQGLGTAANSLPVSRVARVTVTGGEVTAVLLEP
jgi:hypothetical protein